MLVHVLADDLDCLLQLRATLAPHHDVLASQLGKDPPSAQADAAVVAADLRAEDNVSAVKHLLPKIAGARKRIFLVDGKEGHRSVVQAHALGATIVLPRPAARHQLLRHLADDGVEVRAGPEKAAAAGVAALSSLFLSAAAGRPLGICEAMRAAEGIAGSIEEDGISGWLEAVRRHHESTCQHCLLVVGLTIDFGLCLGMGRRDIDRLSAAAMLHDVGKAVVPLSVLDKPGRLDRDERALIESHPAAGYDLLCRTPGVSAEVLDAVRHHHEYLDGSGYPDGLCAQSISDVVRILTISDIFAALIERRPYRSPMARDAAYDVLRSMHGKLEKPLVAAFRHVALLR